MLIGEGDLDGRKRWQLALSNESLMRIDQHPATVPGQPMLLQLAVINVDAFERLDGIDSELCDLHGGLATKVKGYFSHLRR